MYKSKFLARISRDPRKTVRVTEGEISRRDLFAGLGALGATVAIPSSRFDKNFDFRPRPTNRFTGTKDYEAFISIWNLQGQLVHRAPIIMRFNADAGKPIWNAEPSELFIAQGTIQDGKNVCKVTVDPPPVYVEMLRNLDRDMKPPECIIWEGASIDGNSGDITITFDPHATISLEA